MLKKQSSYKIKTNEKIKLVSLPTKNFVCICSIYFMVVFNGCASLSSSLTEFLNREASMPVAFKDRKVNEAEKYMAIYDLGGRITTHANFIELLKYIHDDLKKDRIYLTRTDLTCVMLLETSGRVVMTKKVVIFINFLATLL